MDGSETITAHLMTQSKLVDGKPITSNNKVDTTKKQVHNNEPTPPRTCQYYMYMYIVDLIIIGTYTSTYMQINA